MKEINWLPTKERVEQRIATKGFNYWKGPSPFYVNELFVSSRNTYTPPEIRITLGHI